MSIVNMFMISVFAGLLSGMNVWAVNINHMRLHLNDIYMAILMAGWMLLLETLVYYKHIDTSNFNIRILISAAIIIFSIYAIRNQLFVNDEQFLNGMIPHHSMAILMSKKIKEKTKNQQIAKLADNIINTQAQEILLMDSI